MIAFALVSSAGCSEILADFMFHDELDAGVDSGEQIPPDGCRPSAEACNDLDDDCDGRIDEDGAGCSFPNAIAACEAGSCVQLGCVEQWADCSAGELGCETEVTADRLNCGGCANACSPLEDCVGMECRAPRITEVWIANGPEFVLGTAAGSDASGTLFFGGSFTGSVSVDERAATGAGGGDVWLAGIPATGADGWLHLLRGPGEQAFADMTVTATGVTYVLAQFTGEVTEPGGMTLAPVGTRDSVIWSVRPDGTTRLFRRYSSTQTLEGSAIAADASGRVVIAGAYTGSLASETARDRDVFVIDGATATPRFSTFGGAGRDVVADIALGPTGTLYLVGSYAGSIDFGPGPLPGAAATDQQAFVAALAEDGTCLWSRGLGGPALTAGRAIAAGDDGSVYVALYTEDALDLADGITTDDPANGAGVVVALDVDGDYRWHWQSRGAQSSVAWALALDDGGDLFVAGTLGSADGLGSGAIVHRGEDDAFVMRLSGSDGSYRWARSFGGLQLETVGSVSVDSSGSVLVAGSFMDVVDFEVGVETATMIDAFLARIEP